MIRDVSAGQTVGYGSAFVCRRKSKIAVVAAGFADGVCRSRSNHGSMLVRGASVSIVGLISMDLSMIDVTNVPGVSIGDIVTIYGCDGNRDISVATVATELNTVVSELLCSLGSRVPRFYS
jgi:alanine racemase